MEPSGGFALNAAVHIQSSAKEPVDTVSVRIEQATSSTWSHVMKDFILNASISDLSDKSPLTVICNDLLPPDPGLKVWQLMDSTEMDILNAGTEHPCFLIFKALQFVRIVGKTSDSVPRDDIVKFMGTDNDGRLVISLTNRGPPRSGFASSSAVSSALLFALFKCMKWLEFLPDANAVEDDGWRERLAQQVWLFECQCGLRSGRQVKITVYRLCHYHKYPGYGWGYLAGFEEYSLPT